MINQETRLRIKAKVAELKKTLLQVEQYIRETPTDTSEHIREKIRWCDEKIRILNQIQTLEWVALG